MSSTWRRSLSLALILLVGACTGEAEPSTTTGGVTTTLLPTTTTTAATTTTVSVGECRDTFCVRYHIRPEAAWADGTPVTATDFVFTYETIVDPAYEIASREGYHLITGYEVVDEKTVLFAFDEIYAPWQTLFSTVLPAHILEGQPFDTAWDDAITMGSGPFTFVEWVPEDRIVLARNPDYWGGAQGDVQTLNIVFYPNAASGADALSDGEMDVFYPQPYLALVEDIDNMGGIEWSTGVGPVWEYFGFNQDDARLQQLFIRQAITQGINREAILDAVVRPITPGGRPPRQRRLAQRQRLLPGPFQRPVPLRPGGGGGPPHRQRVCPGGRWHLCMWGRAALILLGDDIRQRSAGPSFRAGPGRPGDDRHRDHSQIRPNLRAAPDGQPAGWRRCLAGDQSGLGRPARPGMGQHPLLLPG
jgi:hypothetical protein